MKPPVLIILLTAAEFLSIETYPMKHETDTVEIHRSRFPLYEFKYHKNSTYKIIVQFSRPKLANIRKRPPM